MFNRTNNNKKSFFERLTGIVEDDAPAEFQPRTEPDKNLWSHRELPVKMPSASHSMPMPEPEEEAEGQLAVDVYQTRTEIIVQTMAAGIRPDDLNISITHDKITISGRREGPHGIPPEDYFHSELYWGNFSRTVFLPQEIEPEEAEAIEKHGLLILRLPKVDKEREHKIKIKQL